MKDYFFNTTLRIREFSIFNIFGTEAERVGPTPTDASPSTYLFFFLCSESSKLSNSFRKDDGNFLMSSLVISNSFPLPDLLLKSFTKFYFAFFENFIIPNTIFYSNNCTVFLFVRTYEGKGHHKSIEYPVSFWEFIALFFLRGDD